MSHITMKKIAEDLGLSRNTVSLALKDDPRVSAETKRKIISYAVSVGYFKLSPDELNPYQTGSPIQILVIRRIDKTAYWDKIINGISEEASRYNFKISISVVTQENADGLVLPSGYSEDINVCIFLHKYEEAYVKKLLAKNIIGIFLDYKSYECQEPIMGDMIKSEGRRSMMQITRSLLSQGMTKIGYMCPYYIKAETFDDRYEGFRAAMEEANVPILPEYVVRSSPCQDKALALKSALEQYPDLPEAIVCANDDSAIRLANLLIEQGIRIPEDVAITGFDNDEYDSFAPFFTTVESDAFQIGRRTIQQVVWRMQHPDAPFETITIASSPVYRRSSQKVLIPGNNYLIPNSFSIDSIIPIM